MVLTNHVQTVADCQIGRVDPKVIRFLHSTYSTVLCGEMRLQILLHVSLTALQSMPTIPSDANAIGRSSRWAIQVQYVRDYRYARRRKARIPWQLRIIIN